VAKPVQPRLVTAPVPPAPEPTKEIEIDKESLLTFAIHWIASRTGFPASVFAPDNRLHSGRRPAVLANESLSRLIDAILEQDSRNRPPGDAADSRQIQLPSVPGLAEWDRTFPYRLSSRSNRYGASEASYSTAPPATVLMAHVSTDLAELLANVPHAFVMVEHETVTAGEDLAEVTRDEFAALLANYRPGSPDFVPGQSDRGPSRCEAMRDEAPGIERIAARYLSCALSPGETQIADHERRTRQGFSRNGHLASRWATACPSPGSGRLLSVWTLKSSRRGIAKHGAGC
jgi:hypothetical protein